MLIFFKDDLLIIFIYIIIKNSNIFEKSKAYKIARIV